MSSRQGSGPSSHRQRSRDFHEDFPPLPPMTPLLNSTRDRDNAASSLQPNRPQTHYWPAAARRAERIRSLDEIPTSVLDEFDRTMDQTWYSRRAGRMRNALEGRSSNFEDLDRTLDEANSHLRALLDLTTQTHLTSSLVPPIFSPPLRSHDFSDDNRRNKRRKLDSDRLASGFTGFRYGKYGQVEPGQLRMEIVSCDGGVFPNEEASHTAENILKNDNSVYCTRGNRCNIVLRHQGATVFTLQELVIKAPGSEKYSHPVREGMVFIAMDQDDMLSRTAQYQIQYAPMPRGQSWHGEGDNGLSFEREPSHIISIRHHDDGTTSTRARRAYVHRSDDDDRRVPQMPDEFATNLPDFRVTTECSDGEEDDDHDDPRLRRPPNRIGSLPFETPDSDSEGLTNPFVQDLADLEENVRLYRSRRSNIIRERTRDRDPDPDRMPSISLSEAMDAHTQATQEAIRAVGGGELLTPHARFFIEKKTSKCTIKFDPPVSGRFILLKMWSAHHGPKNNIDIKSVIARGFAGPRYFPSVQLR